MLREECEQAEARIKERQQSYVLLGLDLEFLRDKRAYWGEAHKTFEEYVRATFDLSPSHAYELIEAAKVAAICAGGLSNVRQGGDSLRHLNIPRHERQARALTGLSDDKVTEAAASYDFRTTPTEVIEEWAKEQVLPPAVVPTEWPDDTFAVIYADPPWQYSNEGFTQSAASHYRTMPTEEIAAFSGDVKARSTPASVLFLWTTSPLLPEGLEVMREWAFEYKASMVWDKGRAPGIGWFVRTHHELLLIGVREDTPHPKIKPVSILRASPTRHSAKPAEMYEIIESMYSGPYLELFARTRRDGWEVFGNVDEIGAEVPTV